MLVNGKRLCGNCFCVKKSGVCPKCGYTKNAAADVQALPRGTRLGGKYIVDGEIGRGGFGITYLAYDKRNGKTVAVKEYFPSMLATRTRKKYVIPDCEKNAEQFNIGAEKFFDEAELVRQFNGNPNIVSIYECFYENNTAYFIMEYLDGITVENYIKNYGALDPAQALYIADKLTMALEVLQSANIFHRDISPDNVMICRNGNVKLIDFGAARRFLSGTNGFTVVMKTGFSPMEQYSGDAADIRSDIYSVGALLYYALTGTVPESPYKRLENDSLFQADAANIGAEFPNVIKKAAAIMPAERFKSVRELRNALSQLNIKPAAVELPADYNALKNERFKYPDRRRRFPAAAAVAAVCLAAFCAMTAAKKPIPPAGNQVTELALDKEYAGDFNISKIIPASELKKFGGDVEITLYFKPWEDMDPQLICGFIPVNSDDEAMIEYLYAPNELWTDPNGWISVDKDMRSLSLVLSADAAEKLGGGLGFEVYNLVITSAELKCAQTKQSVRTDDWYELRNAAYSVSDNGNGKIITVPLCEDRIQEWPSFESQAIPKQALCELDGDVKITLTIEPIDGREYEQRIVYTRNSGYCFQVLDKYIKIPAQRDENGNSLVKCDRSKGAMLGRDAKQLTVILPKNAKEKVSSGVFFQSMGVKITQARLESYNGEFDEFL